MLLGKEGYTVDDLWILCSMNLKMAQPDFDKKLWWFSKVLYENGHRQEVIVDVAKKAVETVGAGRYDMRQAVNTIHKRMARLEKMYGDNAQIKP